MRAASYTPGTIPTKNLDPDIHVVFIHTNEESDVERFLCTFKEFFLFEEKRKTHPVLGKTPERFTSFVVDSVHTYTLAKHQCATGSRLFLQEPGIPECPPPCLKNGDT